MKQKIIFFDIDGTLYTHSNHDICKSTQKALMELKKQGHKICVATSRALCELVNLPRFFREFDFDAMCIDGGALLISKEHIIKDYRFNHDDMQALINYTRPRKIFLRYSTYEGSYIDGYYDESHLDAFFYLYLTMPTYRPYRDEYAYNLLAYTHNEQESKQLIACLKHSNVVIHTPTIIEMTNNSVDKSVGVKDICEYFEFSDHMNDVICFGDGANDAKMLKEAGIGISFKNAHPDAIAACDKLADAIENDGIYRICKELELI